VNTVRYNDCRNYAEALIYAAELLLYPHSLLITTQGYIPAEVDFMAFALAFYRKPPLFKFRAMIEDWNGERIMYEMDWTKGGPK
jgi:hypothetical protein